MAWLLVVVAAVVATGDWVAVHTRRKRLEYVCKPAVMVALVGAALTIDATDGATRSWFVVALALSLLGDVFLMVTERPWTFPSGLASFVLAHLAYIVGFFVEGVTIAGLAIGTAVIAVAVATLGRLVHRAVRASPESELVAPVTVYIGVISAMVASATGTLDPLAIAGAALFYASDALIAWNRFVHHQRHGRLAIIVTYHLAQALLVLSLASAT
ncbi:MAG: lysoplasmalogenase [Acidimicrobiales bacterium]